MSAFEFFSISRVIVGPGSAERLGELARSFGARALVVYNGGEAVKRRAAELLQAGDVDPAFFRLKGEPRVEDVDGAVAAGKQAASELVIGVGGGSAIDLAKAAAGLLANGGSALDYMEVVGKGMRIDRPALPWIAVPTTAGTGAEVTRNAVIALPQKSFKASIRSEHLLARIALVDAQLGLDVPPEVTASSGMDALCQLIEAYTSSGASPMTDALAVKGIELAGRSLPRAYENGRDLAARQDMALAALLSGMALTNAGLGAVHGFAAPLGARFPVPHGVVCAALLPHVIRANAHAARRESGQPVLGRYAHIGRILAGRDLDDTRAVEACIELTTRLVRDLRIPPLCRYGLGEQHVHELVMLARKSSSMKYNPVSLGDAELAGALGAAIAGGPGD